MSLTLQDQIVSEYWDVVGMDGRAIKYRHKAKDIADRYGFRSLVAMRAQIDLRHGWTDVTCSDCGKPRIFSNREELQRHWNHPGRCPACTAMMFERGRQARQVLDEAKPQPNTVTQHRTSTMPYREYLKTEEWEVRRQAALRRADYRCQVCNAPRSARLNVHHRTYERRGIELESDLTVLCEDCHSLFHEHGKLAKEHAHV